MATSMKMAVFWNVVPCNLADIYRNSAAYWFHHQGDASHTTHMMKAVRSSETLVSIDYTVKHAEDIDLNGYF
jgi:5-keto 4-deoxyuronate isomerase